MERLSRDALVSHQRERIVSAAIGVFAKRGFQRTTIDNITAAAGSSVGGFYGLFRGKEDCFLQCYDRVVAEGRTRITAEMADSGSWVDGLCSAMLGILRAVEEEPLAARIALVEVHGAGPEALKRYDQELASLVPRLREGRDLLPSGERLPQRLEEASIAGAAWLLHQRLVHGEAKGTAELLQEFLAILAGSYLGESRARRLADRALAAHV